MHAHGSNGHGHAAAVAGDPHDHHAHVGPGDLRAFRVGTLLNIALVAVEAAVGFAIGSMALLGDAGHNLIDVLGLALAWGAARLATRRPTARHTYGLARSTILAALLNAALLLVACGALAWESAQRVFEAHPVPAAPVMVVAAVATLINLGTAALFWRRRREDLNARGAFLHMAADAAVSAGVVLVGAVVWFTGWAWVDPVAGLAIAAAILVSGWGLLRQSVDLSLDAVPRGLDVHEIDRTLREIAGVVAVHDLHVWPLSTTVAAITAHVEHDGSRGGDELLAEAQALLRERFGLEHATLQFERLACDQRC